MYGLRIAVLSAMTTGTGLAIYAYRCAHARLGDGPISFGGAMAMGMLLLVVPFAFITYLVISGRPSLSVFAAVLSCAAAIVTAVGRPGNLMGVGFLFTFTIATFLLCLAEAILRSRRSAR